MWGHMESWGGWGGFGLFHLLWWALLIVAGVWLVRWLIGVGRRNDEPPADRALQLLRERFARGEIDADEFEARKRELG